jgi:ABC-type Fe3+/spermidine/putrescine transport system ATPase subunit
MDKGRWGQTGTAEDLYDYPKNRLVAQLLGDVNYVSSEDVETLSKSDLAYQWPMHHGKYLIRPEDAIWIEWVDALEVANEIFQGDHWLVEVKLPSGASAFFRKSRQ